MVPIRRAVEAFHLSFLRALVAKGPDKGLIALKGGCNLRFYFGSTRYSEDIDLDVTVVAVDTLRRRVDGLLASPVVTAPLRRIGVEIADVSTPKQTATTQRWKVGLRVEGVPMRVPTKIEFSRRDAIVGAVFEVVDAEVCRAHALPPFLATHYPLEQAIAQKVAALAGRAEPQSRDVFDLNLLFARPEAGVIRVERAEIARAIEQAMALGFDDYQGAVVAFLEPEQVDALGTLEAWDAMQQHVLERLEAL